MLDKEIAGIADRPLTVGARRALFDEYRQVVQPFVDLKLRLFRCSIPRYIVDLDEQTIRKSDDLTDEMRALRDELDRMIVEIGCIYRNKIR